MFHSYLHSMREASALSATPIKRVSSLRPPYAYTPIAIPYKVHHRYGKGTIVSFTRISNGIYNVSALTSPLKTKSYIAIIDL